MEKKSLTILILDSEDSGQTGKSDSATEELAWETGLGHAGTACDSL